jgi:pilus assembly protein CpaE
MDTWILSECGALTASIRNSLLRLGIDCPSSRIVSAAELDRLAACSDQPGKLVFCAFRQLTTEHFELLRRLRAVTDKELVVVAPAPDHATLLNAIRAGATDYLSADSTLDGEVEEFIARARADRAQNSSKGRIITVVPCHGPCDGSVLSANVAAVLAQRFGTCGLLDFHLRGGELALLLKANPRHTLFDLLDEFERIDEAMLQQAMTLHGSGVRLLAAPPMFSDLRGFGSGICQRILALTQHFHQFVLVNCEDIAHAEQIQSIAASDDILLAMRMDLVSLHRAKQHMDFMVRNRVPAARIHVVAMGTGHCGELPANAVKNLLGVRTIHLIPDDQAAVNVSINVGNPFVLESPKLAISKALVALVDKITGFDKEKPAPTLQRTWLGKAAAALAIHTASY